MCKPKIPLPNHKGSSEVSRDEFSQPTKDALAKRVGFCCSNPSCKKLTSGPHSDPAKSLNIGVAAHMTAAASGGPRYDGSLSSADRKAPENGIFDLGAPRFQEVQDFVFATPCIESRKRPGVLSLRHKTRAMRAFFPSGFSARLAVAVNPPAAAIVAPQLLTNLRRLIPPQQPEHEA